MTSPNVALIGAGYWGRNLARNLHALGVLNTLCDPNPQVFADFETGYENVRRETDVDRVLANREVTRVVIAAPARLHYSLTKAALEAGKDVMVEKPLCLDHKSGHELVSLAQLRGRILMVGHLLQYHPAVRKLRDLVREGVLGRLHYITSNRLNLGKIRREENALWSFAPHDLSVILALAGDALPVSVRAVGDAYLNREVADTTLTMLEFESGLRAHVYVSWLNPFKEQKLTVVGSGGMAVFDDTREWPDKLLLHQDYLQWKGGEVPHPSQTLSEAIALEPTEPLFEECSHFLNCCDARSVPETDGVEGLRVLRILEAAQTSLDRDGQCIRIAHPADPSVWDQPQENIHHTATVDPGAVIGTGTRVWHYSHIASGAEIGERCVLGQNTFVAPGVHIGNNVKIQNNVSIYTGVRVEDDVFLGPSCVLTNVTNPRSQIRRHDLYEETLIRKGASIGANATIVSGVTLGRYCFVAAGAVVTRDVPDYGLVKGSPARRTHWMSRHGHVLRSGPDGTLVCPESGYRYREVEPNRLQCLDLDEDAPLPPSHAVGERAYRDIKETGGHSSGSAHSSQ